MRDVSLTHGMVSLQGHAPTGGFATFHFKHPHHVVVRATLAGRRDVLPVVAERQARTAAVPHWNAGDDGVGDQTRFLQWWCTGGAMVVQWWCDGSAMVMQWSERSEKKC